MGRKLKEWKDESPLFELNGKTGGLVYYRLNDKPVVRRAGKVCLKQYRQGANFAELRKHQSEFGLCSQYGKRIRESMGAYLPPIQDHTCSGRLTGALRKCLAEGKGVKGQRVFTQESLQGLKGFGFKKEHCFPASFFHKLRIATAPNRQGVSVCFEPGVLPQGYQSLSRVLTGIIFLSSTVYGNGYTLLEEEWHGRSFFREMRMDKISKEVRYQVQFPPEEKMPEEVFIIGLAGLLSDEKETGRGWLVV